MNSFCGSSLQITFLLHITPIGEFEMMLSLLLYNLSIGHALPSIAIVFGEIFTQVLL
jgi:hypothetical protein